MIQIIKINSTHDIRSITITLSLIYSSLRKIFQHEKAPQLRSFYLRIKTNYFGKGMYSLLLCCLRSPITTAKVKVSSPRLTTALTVLFGACNAT